MSDLHDAVENFLIWLGNFISQYGYYFLYDYGFYVVTFLTILTVIYCYHNDLTWTIIFLPFLMFQIYYILIIEVLMLFLYFFYNEHVWTRWSIIINTFFLSVVYFIPYYLINRHLCYELARNHQQLVKYKFTAFAFSWFFFILYSAVRGAE